MSKTWRDLRYGSSVWSLMASCLMATCLFGQSSEAPTEEISSPPSLIVAQDQEVTVTSGQKITLAAIAPEARSWEWKLEGSGRLSEDTFGKTVIYTAPLAIESIDVLTIVTGHEVGSSSSSLTIRVVAPESKEQIDEVKSPPHIDLEEIGSPSGWMGEENGVSIRFESAPCDDKISCWQCDYRPTESWAGIYWWPEECEVLDKPGDGARRGKCSIDVAEKAGVKKIVRLKFWARGDRGDETVRFGVGGYDLPPGKRVRIRATLERAWKLYSIDLGEIPMTEIAGLFFWEVRKSDNRNGARFYLKGMRFEGVR